MTDKERYENDSKFISGLRHAISDVRMYQERKYSPETIALAQVVHHSIDAVIKAIASGFETTHPPEDKSNATEDAATGGDNANTN